MNENLLLNVITGKATNEEKEEFYGCLENSKEEEELFYTMKGLWLRVTMQNTTAVVDSDFEDLWQKIKSEKRTWLWIEGKRMLRYAAIFIFILGIGGLGGYYITTKNIEYPDPKTQKFTATRGSVSVLELSDGTKVWLNSESKLTYHEDYKNTQRYAELTGEAYFEVVHRDDFPFLVKAGNLLIHDLGTTFNIKAYPEDNYIETSLVEGKVDILSPTGNPIVSLEPGESAMYLSNKNEMVLRTIADNVLSAWRDGKFVIRDQRLEDIFTELSRWYGVEFRFENDKFRDYRFTGNIKKTTTAQHVLKVLEATAHFKYRIVENVDKSDLVIIY
ncbi:FecR family protein [Mariniphaga anaerophila]|uniref:FecR family protein n=1 Tax=Mariniphaga anaerophila TaxID=1484053 RepID=A0A1M4SQU9_9BACT|nr:FecR family protein [Mariniphaga anaerophila]SHE34578.1 FecR family protein [Mariniphaga anaerophila]